MKTILSFLAILSVSLTNVGAQTRNPAAAIRGVVVEYSNANSSSVCRLTANDSVAMVSVEKFETIYIDYQEGRYTKVTTAKGNGDTVFCVVPFTLGGGDVELVESQSEMIAGWECRKYSAGDGIVLWVTEDVGYNGTPITFCGIPQGLVLRVVRDGKVLMEATEVSRLINAPVIDTDIDGRELSPALYSSFVVLNYLAQED